MTLHCSKNLNPVSIYLVNDTETDLSVFISYWYKYFTDPFWSSGPLVLVILSAEKLKKMVLYLEE